MSNYKSYIDDFDPRGSAENSSASAKDGEYTPRHTRRGATAEEGYRPRHPASGSKSEVTSPSPVMEGGDDDFDVFNFDLARRRKKEREDRLNAELARQEAPREIVRKIAEKQPPRRRPAPEKRRPPDREVQRASDFVSKLSGYAQPLATVFSTAGSRSGSKGGSSSRSHSKGGSSRSRSGNSGGSSRKPTGSSGGRKPTSGKSGGQQTVSGYFEGLPRPLRTVVIIGCVLLVILLVYYAAFGALLADMNSLRLTHRKDAPVSEAAGLELMSSPGVTNILLLGIDDDGSSGSRSDTMMIASLDVRGGAIRLCSILRDCYVAIPEHGSNRINSAYAYGGAQLAVQTVENNFRVKIDHCVTIDMAALVDVVDAMGGVEIELTPAEAEQVNLHSHCGKTTAAGKQILNGKQAVTYAQIRKIDSDFKRTQRQRTLINAIVAKMRSLGVGELLNVVQAVAPNVTTDMSSAEIATLALKALPALSGEMGQLTIPDTGKYSNTTINGMSVLKLDLEANVKLLHSYLFDE